MMLYSKPLQDYVRQLLTRYDPGKEETPLHLKQKTGDELLIEQQVVPNCARISYFVPDSVAGWRKELEISFWVSEQGNWIPFAFFRVTTGDHAYGQVKGRRLTITDASNQQALVAYCDIWAFRLRDQKWLQYASKITPDGLEHERGFGWPEPTEETPDLDTLIRWTIDGVGEATDACLVEADGVCPHGHPAWLLRLGLV
jgi:hypothetical protein